MNQTEEIFSKIYTNGVWGATRSGQGSTIEYTKNLRKELPIIFDKFDIKIFLDAPCGDMTWMPLVLAEYPIEYIGGDIVKEMIDAHSEKFLPNENVTPFMHLNICTDPLPSADLWMCRDCLFHLSEKEIFMAFNNFVKSDIKYILTTTHMEDSYNTHVSQTMKYEGNYDIGTGGFRLLNLFDSPYNFPTDPLYRLDDSYVGFPKREMCLWSREQIAKVLD